MPLLIVIIALLVIGGGVYIYENKKVDVLTAVDNTAQQSNIQNSPATNQQDTSIIKTTPVSNPIPIKSSVTVSSPNGGENYIAGNVITVKWISNNVPTTNVANVSLVRVDGEYSGVTVDSQASANITSGIFNYTSPVTLPMGQYKIAVYSCPLSTGKPVDCTTGDYSDAPFMIKNIASPSTVTPNPLSITVISPSAGSVLQVGQPYKITWSGHFERGDEVFGINSYPVGSDTFGTIATVPIAQASCTGGGMGQWANPSTCSYTWTPTYPTPGLQISIFNNRNGDQFGSSGIFSLIATNVSSNQASITVISPNGGENIPYGTIYMAGDLGFTWRTSLGSNYKPTSEFYAALVDENNVVVRSDGINSKTNTGNGIFSSSFIGESKIQISKKYKIRVCDEIEYRKVICDDSDNYFTVTN